MVQTRTPKTPAATLAVLRADPTWEQRILAELARRRPENDDQLHAWVQRVLGFKIARWAVCPGSTSPFEFLSALYFNRVTNALALGPRGGGKTLLMSIAEWMMACRQPTWIFHCAGIEEQARRGYAYLATYKDMPHFKGFLTDSLMSQTRWANGSLVEVHSATMNQVSGAHPDCKVADEVEKWPSLQVLETFLGMGTKEGAQTAFISTRERAVGLMQKLIEEAPRRGIKIYQWNIFDIKQRCPECLKADCELYETECQGRYKDSDGHRSRKNIIDKYLSLSRDVWEAQFLCLRPGAQGLCFPDFVDVPGDPEHSNVTESAEFDPAWGVFLAMDDNVAMPRCGLYCQLTSDGHIHVFDVYYEAGRLHDRSVADIMARLAELGKFPEVAIVPPEATALKIAFHQADVDTASPRNYRRAQGAAVLAQFIRSNNGQRRLLIHPRCKPLIHSLRSAYREELYPGQYGDEPAKSPDDHPTDAACYMAWMHRFDEEDYA